MRISLAINRAGSQTPRAGLASSASPARPTAIETGVAAGEYANLIGYLFSGPAAIAIVSRSSSSYLGGVSGVAQGIAKELGACSKRVVIVSVNKLLRMEDTKSSDDRAFAPGTAPLVWHWPASAKPNIEFFNPRVTENWLESLRRSFYGVLLDCLDVDVTPGLAELAATADAAVLTVEAGRTSKLQIQREQRVLQLSGAKVAGTILIR